MSTSRKRIPKTVVRPGEGAWIEARQGTGLTLVRNECFASPSGHARKTYANYTVYDAMQGQEAKYLDTSDFSNNASVDISDISLDYNMDASRPGSSSAMHRMRTASIQPSASKASRPCSNVTKPRPQSSLAHSSLSSIDTGPPKRPHTSMGTRTLGPVEMKTKLHVTPARTPLRPVTPIGFLEQQQVEQDFLRYVSAGEYCPPARRSPRAIEKMKGLDSKEMAAMDTHRIERKDIAVEASKAPSTSTNRDARRARWQEIIDMRRSEQVRTVPGLITNTKIVRPKEPIMEPRRYVAPPVIITVASQNLLAIKGDTSRRSQIKRFWVEKKMTPQEFKGKVGFGLATNLKKMSKKSSEKIIIEHEWIKSILHAEGREEPLNKNAEEWINGFGSLMDKRTKLRHFQRLISKAQENMKEASFYIKQKEAMLKQNRNLETGEIMSEKERNEVIGQMEQASQRFKEFEIEFEETKSLADCFSLSVEELSFFHSTHKNETGDSKEWRKFNEQLQHGEFKDDESEFNYFRKAQDALEMHRHGWWEEDDSPNKPYDIKTNEIRALEESEGSVSSDDDGIARSSDAEVQITGWDLVLGKVIERATKDTPLSQEALTQGKIQIRDKCMQKQVEWAKRDRETPVWERDSEYHARRLSDLEQCRSLYTDFIKQEDLDSFYEKKRVSQQKARYKHHIEHSKSNALWPVLDTRGEKKTKKEKQKEPEKTEAEVAEEAGEGTEVVPLKCPAAEDDSLALEGDLKDGTGKEAEVLEDSSSGEEDHMAEDMARLQEAAPGVAYRLIRRLRYPIQTANLAAWQGSVTESEERKRAQVAAYERMCRFFKAMPVGSRAIKNFIFSKTADKLSIPGINWGLQQVSAFAAIMKGIDVTKPENMRDSADLVPLMSLRLRLDYHMLEHLDCANNNLGGKGADQLIDCLLQTNVRLKSFNISGNNLGEVGAKAMVLLISQADSPLEDFVADENHFGDGSSATIVKVASTLTGLRRMSMQKNKVGVACSHQLCHMLIVCKSLEELELGWNELRGKAALTFAAGLRENITLRRLDLQWNSFGDSATMRAFANALTTCKIRYVNLSENRIGAAGCALLADGLEHNTDLLEIVLDGNALTMQGTRELMRTASERVTRSFSIKHCTFSRHSGVAFDPAEPAGVYLLDLNDPYSHRILKNLIRYQLSGKGAFDKTTPCIIMPTPGADEGKNFKMDFASEADALFPENGFIKFTFLDRQKVKLKNSTMNPCSLQLLLQQLNDQKINNWVDVQDLLQATVGDTYMSLEQLKTLYKAVNKYQPKDRMNLFSRCYHRVADVEHGKESLNLLKPDEQIFAEKELGEESLGFCPNNPTGYHKLDLAKPPHRDVALSLIQIKNEMEELEAACYKYYDNRGGGKRDLSAIGVVWRNSKYKTGPFTFQQSWKVPYSGILEVDFVDIRKPPENAQAMSDEEFQKLVLTTWDERSELLNLSIISNQAMVKTLRDLSNSNYFTCKQIARMIGRFDPSRAADIRVEILVTCWARTIDWHGLSNVLNLLSAVEQAIVTRRLGPLQTFDEMMAVGFYELHLNNPSERFIFQELVHLGGKEGKDPSASMVQLNFDGKGTDPESLPGKFLEWLAGGIPEHGTITLFFVRTQACLNKVFEKGAFDHSKRMPTASSKSVFMESYLAEFCQEGFCSPGGKDWILPYMCRRVRRKLGDKFAAAEHAFYALDDDDSGFLITKELGSGLQALDIFLNAEELNDLMRTLDQNENGKIEVDEILAFWNKYTTEIFL